MSNTTESEVVFAPGDLRGAVPSYVVETYAMLCRELHRTQGMIDDLHAFDDCGLTATMMRQDCDLLRIIVTRKYHLLDALSALRALYAAP